MIRATFLFAMLYWFLPLTGHSQILNIDKTDTADYTSKTHTSLQLSTGLEVDKQQHTLWDATNTAELLVQKKKEMILVAGSYRFTYNGPDDILNAGFIHIRHRHNYRNKFQPETFLQYQWDNKRGLEQRALMGINIRYNIWRNDVWELNAGLGLMYESERWNYAAVDSVKIPPNAIPISNHLIKVNSYIRLNWKTSANSDISANLFIQTKPDSFTPRIAPGFIWNIQAGKHIGFSLNFSGIYDQSPVVPIHPFYYSFSNSLLLKI